MYSLLPTTPKNFWLACSLFGLLVWACQSKQEQQHLATSSSVDFNYHIKPILSDRCFACHGPDANQRKANLRLDLPEGLFEQVLESGGKAVVAGNPQRSEVYRRIMSHDPEVTMPPPESNLEVTPREQQLIRQWIEEGATYQPHWAFIPPKQSPYLKSAGVSPIDFYVKEKLQHQGLALNEAASKEILLRRVYLDLIGLPPTLEEIDSFLTDDSPYAFEKVVDQLLASPHFGERMAIDWMDVARYADSHGFSQDGYRNMAAWRSWVIDAFNQNMPLDQFIVWQLAGDQLESPSHETLLATAFLRNSRSNSEGGIVQEEYRIETAADRTHTVATAFLGLTMECARCHDHKYDPISQKEYYQLFAFFNQANELGLVRKDGNNGREILLTPPAIQQQLDFLNGQITSLEQQQQHSPPSSPFPLPTPDYEVNFSVANRVREKGREVIRGALPTEDLGIRGDPQLVEVEEGKALQLSGHDFVYLGGILRSIDRQDPFSVFWEMKLHLEGNHAQLLARTGGKNNSNNGFECSLHDGHLVVRLAHSQPGDMLEVRSIRRLENDQWYRLGMTYDGSGKAAGITLYLNETPLETEIYLDQLQRTILGGKNKSLALGGKKDYAEEVDDGYFWIKEVKLYERDLRQSENPTFVSLQDSLTHYRIQKFALQDSLESIMVMQDIPEHRKTFVMDRGVYNALGEEVLPGTPEQVLAFPDTYPADRLGLARWLIHPEHPLTSRVLANRLWQQLWGRGLVATPEDFGNQGELPSHPELLDYLAIRLRESGWDAKALLKEIVLSDTYQQSSTVAEEVPCLRSGK